MVLKIRVGNLFTLIHICQNILRTHYQPKHSQNIPKHSKPALLEEQGYPKKLMERTLSKVTIFCSGRQSALKQKAKPPRKFYHFSQPSSGKSSTNSDAQLDCVLLKTSLCWQETSSYISYKRTYISSSRIFHHSRTC